MKNKTYDTLRFTLNGISNDIFSQEKVKSRRTTLRRTIISTQVGSFINVYYGMYTMELKTQKGSYSMKNVTHSKYNKSILKVSRVCFI